MGIRRFCRRLILGKSSAAPEPALSWKQRYTVGQATYGKPAIRHWGEPATLKVGSYCSFAINVTIFLGGNHRVDWITTYPFSVFRESARNIPGHPATRGDVIIGHDVWIGEGATILSGVRIGNGAVVGAHAVVSRDVPAYGIVAGNPAKLIRKRFSDDEIASLERIAWWDWPEDVLDQAMPYLLSPDLAGLLAFAEQQSRRRESSVMG